MTSTSATKVRMFVFNNCANDARVLKESASLVKAGYDVEVVAFLDQKTQPSEVRDGVRITRFKIDPLNLKLLRALGNPLNYRPKFLMRRRSSSLGAGTGLRRRPRILRKIRVWGKRLRDRVLARLDIRAKSLDQAKEQFLQKFISLFFQAPFLVLQVLVFGLIYGLLRLVYSRLVRFRRFLKNAIRSVSRFLIQRPIRWLLQPTHRYFVYYEFYRKLVRYSQEHPADIYHCHDLNTLYIGITLKKKQGAKLIYDSHELYLHKNRMFPPGKLKLRLLRKIETEGMALADRVITVGECIADWMAESYQSTKPAVIINAPEKRDDARVDQNTSLRRELGIADDTFLLIYSGGITFNRGLENVIRAVGKVEGLHFVMLGYGTDAYMATLKDLIAELGYGKKISFFGPVQHFEVASYLASADCGIAPIMNICLSYYYCSPNKLFEYVQARLPVIASNFPEMERVVNESDIGLTFDPEDVDSIVASIETMRDDDALRAKFAQNTHAASDRYRWAVEEQKLIEIYRAI